MFIARIAGRLGLFAAVAGGAPAAAAVQGGPIADERAAEDRRMTPMTRRRGTSAAPLVDYLYTYGAPGVAAGIANPGGMCIPGIRTYTEDVASARRCRWWQWWCNPNERITNTDFAAQWHADDYPHPKQSVLVLRYRDGRKVEHIYKPCDDSKRGTQSYQYLPSSDEPANIVWHIHDIEEHYERRLMKTPSSVRGPLLDYTSVTMCHDDNIQDISACLEGYERGMNGLEGISEDGWTPLAVMNHVTASDEDSVFVLKKDDQGGGRRCIISFKEADSLFGDLSDYLFYSPSAYCGKDSVHNGVRDELSQITHSSQYQDVIKPALETCQEVTCVGYSLGGSLCNIFTLCANQGMPADSDGLDDWEALVWQKPGGEPE